MRYGATVTQRYSMDSPPTSIRLSVDNPGQTSGVNTWGIWRITLDCGDCEMVLLEDPLGGKGTPHPFTDRFQLGTGNWSQYWLGMLPTTASWLSRDPDNRRYNANIMGDDANNNTVGTLALRVLVERPHFSYVC
jgi:hypothetical protein